MAESSETRRSAREREIFLAALERASASDREAFLEDACAGDAVLRERVGALLVESSQVGDFLETPAVGGNVGGDGGRLGPRGTAILAELTEKPGDRIGRYKLLQLIGEGGCGVVYMAEQEEPIRRRVALKIIRLGMDTRSVIARFEAERQALALMDHPNIARVLDAGATDKGRPYFVMELVRGIKITEYCDRNHLSSGERLRLMMQVCQAIQHAHQKGVIHRDIKPSNILVTLHDGVPVPKVIDFGIAKATEQRLTDKTLFTGYAAFIGTPAYMSPEQAEMSGLDVDTRSDVYSLGVLLYELLTGTTPFDPEALLKSGLDGCRRTIRETEPARPSTRVATLVDAQRTSTAVQRRTEPARLIHLLRGDLDWIVMKCLEKDRTRRYPTVNAFAADLQRFLENEPVLARPPSTVYRFQKMLRKHRGAFIAASLIALTLIAGAGLSVWLAIRATAAERDALSSRQQEFLLRRQAESERERAEREKGLARLNEYIADMNLAQAALSDGNLGRAIQLLRKHEPATGEPDLRGFEWRYLWQRCQGDPYQALPDQPGPVHGIVFSPTGDQLVLLTEQITVFDLDRQTALLNKRPEGRFSEEPRFKRSQGVGAAVFAEEGTLLAASGYDTIHLWNATDWSELKPLRRSAGPITFSADGKYVATGGSGFRDRSSLLVRELRTGEEIGHFPQLRGPMAFSRDGRYLAADSDQGIQVQALTGGGAPVILKDSAGVFVRGGPAAALDKVLAFSPDGRQLVAARNVLSERGVFVLSIWDTATGEELAVMPNDPKHVEHTSVISHLSFSPDGKLLATASLDYSIRLWDFEERERRTIFRGHQSEALVVAFSRDGETLASGDRDGQVKIWKVKDPPGDEILPGAAHPLAWSKDSQVLLGLTRQNTIVSMNPATREVLPLFELEPVRLRWIPVALSEDLTTFAQSAGRGTVMLRNTETGQSRRMQVSEEVVEVLALSPNGRMLITAARGEMLRLWDLKAGTNTLLEVEAERAMFSPDGRALCLAGRDNVVLLWDLETQAVRARLDENVEFGFAIAFSPDNRVLATACMDNEVRLWEVSTGRFLGSCVGHKQPVFSVAFSRDSRTLATASDDSTLKLWNLATRQELLTDRRLGGAMIGLLFSPDDRMLVGASSPFSDSPSLRLYRAPLLSEIDNAQEPERLPKRSSVLPPASR